MAKHYAFVGSWSFQPVPRGLSVFSYDEETAIMTFQGRMLEDISVGVQLLDRERKILYVTDESGSKRGATVGGQVIGLKLNPETGELTPFTQVETLLPKPSYMTMTKDRQFLLVAHHSNRGSVTKLVQKPDGSFSSETVLDDAGLALIPVHEDGSLGAVMDFYRTTTDRLSHLHCINADPTERMFISCDKGSDAIHSFGLNRDSGRLELLHTTHTQPGSHPRYVAFHPTLPFFLENNEAFYEIFTYRYDVETGALEKIGQYPLLTPEEQTCTGIEPSDMLICPDGKIAYAAVRGADAVVTYRVHQDGTLSRIQKVSCGGNNPRGLYLTPDGKFLLCANVESETVTAMAIGVDGTLGEARTVTNARLAGNISIF